MAKNNPAPKTDKALYSVKFKHDAKTFEDLAHMQYDLFCRRNLFVRMILGVAAMTFGVLKMTNWWGYVLMAYGAYLLTSRYAASNHTAHKLSRAVEESKAGYPSSLYVFESEKLRIFSLPDNEELSALPYSQVEKLGEDGRYYYIFRDNVGGYMIPKEALKGKEDSFRDFIQSKTKQFIMTKRTSPLKRVRAYVLKKENEPEHL